MRSSNIECIDSKMNWSMHSWKTWINSIRSGCSKIYWLALNIHAIAREHACTHASTLPIGAGTTEASLACPHESIVWTAWFCVHASSSGSVQQTGVVVSSKGEASKLSTCSVASKPCSCMCSVSHMHWIKLIQRICWAQFQGWLACSKHLRCGSWYRNCVLICWLKVSQCFFCRRLEPWSIKPNWWCIEYNIISRWNIDVQMCHTFEQRSGCGRLAILCFYVGECCIETLFLHVLSFARLRLVA